MDERGFNFLQRLRLEPGHDAKVVSFANFKRAVREQAGIMRRDAAAAITALPKLLARIDADDLAKFGDAIERLLTIGGPLDAAAQARMREIRRMLNEALNATGATPKAGSGSARPARSVSKGGAGQKGAAGQRE